MRLGIDKEYLGIALLYNILVSMAVVKQSANNKTEAIKQSRNEVIVEINQSVRL